MATMQDIRKLADLLAVERDYNDDGRADLRRENEWVWWEVERRTGQKVTGWGVSALPIAAQE